MYKETIYTSHGPVDVYRTTNDINGNPRYIVHYLALGLPDYVSTEKTSKAGLKKYRGRDFGGGFVFTSYNVEENLEWILKKLHEGVK